jgi:hypothetical protein
MRRVAFRANAAAERLAATVTESVTVLTGKQLGPLRLGSSSGNETSSSAPATGGGNELTPDPMVGAAVLATLQFTEEPGKPTTTSIWRRVRPRRPAACKGRISLRFDPALLAALDSHPREGTPPRRRPASHPGRGLYLDGLSPPRFRASECSAASIPTGSEGQTCLGSHATSANSSSSFEPDRTPEHLVTRLRFSESLRSFTPRAAVQRVRCHPVVDAKHLAGHLPRP